MNENAAGKQGFLNPDVVSKALILAASIIASLLVGLIFLAASGTDPIKAYSVLLFSPAGSVDSIGQVMKGATPLIIIGAGVSIASKCGLSNLGGDGQFYMGALGYILVSLAIGKQLGVFAAVIGVLFGMLLGAATASIAGVFRSYFKVSEIITTLMLNYIVQYFISYLVNGPLKAENSNIAQTEMIPDTMKIPRMFHGTTASWAIIIPGICVIVYWLLMYKTKFGYNIKAVGGSLKAAQYSGINITKYYFLVMAVSGLFGGLAGAVEISSQQYRLIEGLSNDFGFNGILVSLLGMFNPLGVAIAAIFFAWLSAGANIMQITMNIPVTFVAIIKGLMILFILFGMSIKTGSFARFFRKKNHNSEASEKGRVTA